MVGLGNPGREYERTRHNAGYWLVERFAVSCGIASNSFIRTGAVSASAPTETVSPSTTRST